MIEDVVVVNRSELERLYESEKLAKVLIERLKVTRRFAWLWKANAKGYRSALTVQSQLTENWYQAYRRACGFDDEPVLGARPLMGLIYDTGRWFKRIFWGSVNA